MLTLRGTAAKTALRRKKAHEKALEQTLAQTIQIEQQIYQIEAANINQETLAAMKNAGKAMQEINKNTTIESVDQTMYVHHHTSFAPAGPAPLSRPLATNHHHHHLRETLHEQRMLSDEIVNAVTSTPLGDAVDEDALDEEMESLEQEQLDNQMLKTGPVPVGTRLSNLPAPGQAERTCIPCVPHLLFFCFGFILSSAKRKC